MGEWWNETLKIENAAARTQHRIKLREELDAAHRAVQCIGMTNVHGISPAAHVQLDIQLRLANERLMAAYTAYHRALDQ